MGGESLKIVDHHVLYPEFHYGRVEDFHLMVNHIITERLSEMTKNER